MRRRPRTHYTDTQKALMWERWKKGETLHQIARLFDRPHTSIRQILAETGGIRPAERRRASLALTLAEREEIPRALVAGESMRAVAVRLARAPSTISREISRNGGASCYRAGRRIADSGVGRIGAGIAGPSPAGRRPPHSERVNDPRAFSDLLCAEPQDLPTTAQVAWLAWLVRWGTTVRVRAVAPGWDVSLQSNAASATVLPQDWLAGDIERLLAAVAQA